MSTGSLRARVSATILVLLAIVLAVVVATVTLAYRARLEDDLHGRLSHAGAAAEQAGSAAGVKPLIPGLALEGIATRFTPPDGARPPKPSSSVQAHGSLLTLDEVLPDRIRVVFSASSTGIDHAVTNLLLIEVLVAAGALAFAAILVVRGTRTALRPLSTVIDTAVRIAQGDSQLRLNPSRTDTELGRLAAAFDQMLDALETAVEEARASDKATRRFLADASHELRTPIASLQASVETLLREQPERPERDRLEAAVARESERLGRLVDDLLGLARLDAHPSLTDVDLVPMVGQLVDDARSRAPSVAVTLSVDQPARVNGDADALDRLLRNLIENALAAIDRSGRIDIELRRRDGFVEVDVVDDGPGVPEHEAQRIFERFARLDSGKPGHGLGLAIARRIAQQHHGDVTCEPAPSGARFRLRLPAQN